MITERNECNNKVRLCGKVLEQLKFSHSNHGENFYETKLSVKRDSGTEDIIPLIISERINDLQNVKANSFLGIEGEFRSYNTQEHKLKLFVFVKKIITLDYEFYFNRVVLNGYVCKKPIFRETPLGCKITDVLLAVNRIVKYRSDYIPIIVWGRNAEYVRNFNVGEKLQVTGRIQSRIYLKVLDDETVEKRVAYELSVCKLYEVNEKQEEQIE